MKDIHATSETVAVVDGDLEGAAVSGSKSKAEEGDFDISGRGIGAAANLDFVQASLRAESRGACSAVAGGRRGGAIHQQIVLPCRDGVLRRPAARVDRRRGPLPPLRPRPIPQDRRLRR